MLLGLISTVSGLVRTAVHKEPPNSLVLLLFRRSYTNNASNVRQKELSLPIADEVEIEGGIVLLLRLLRKLFSFSANVLQCSSDRSRLLSSVVRLSQHSIQALWYRSTFPCYSVDIGNRVSRCARYSIGSNMSYAYSARELR